LFFECWDWDSTGSDDLIGQFTSTYAELLNKKSFELIEPHKKQKKGNKYVNSGVIEFIEIKEIRKMSFVDYLSAGVEISLVTGIDFTASNGDPRLPTSLHHFSAPEQPNQYMQAIRTVGDVVAPYDYDGWIPVFGFGAKFLDGNVNHCFHVNGTPNPNCSGINGVLQAYQQSFNSLQLYGPTYFAPLIRNIASLAKQTIGSKYYILLIITDGEITDMTSTIEAIKEASLTPLSIIVVGVGNDNFTSMNQLDDDNHVLFSRDIVQFVPFRNYFNQPAGALARDTLAEVPSQLVDFMVRNNITLNTAPR